MTRAEPAQFQYGIRHNAVEDYLYDEKGLRPAPEPDEVEKAFAQLWACAGPFEMPRLECIENNFRAHIAALEAENKRLLDALAYIANTDPDDGGSREFPYYVGSLEVCHEKAREALSSHKTQEVIGKQPETQDCVTCGGRGWEYSPLENKKVDCPVCNGTGDNT